MFHLGIITGLIDGLNLGGLIPVPCYLMCVRHNSCTGRLPFSNIVVLFYLCTEFSAHPFRGFLQDIYCTVYNGDLTASSPTIKFTSIDAKKKQIKMSNFYFFKPCYFNLAKTNKYTVKLILIEFCFLVLFLSRLINIRRRKFRN